MIIVATIIGLFFYLSVEGELSDDLYSGCDISTYYDTLSSHLNNRGMMHDLIKKTHTNSLPYTSSKNEDVWSALIDLDGVLTQVHLIYTDSMTNAFPHGTSETWNREHIFPKSLGVGTSGPAFTDVHSLKPADANVNSARGNKWFGECGTINPMDECVIPAHREASLDTAADKNIFLPPLDERGDIARSLFYMALRYDGSDGYDLKLSDCPQQEDPKTHMGYLSQLLKWHVDDPVNSMEVNRNDRVCRRYQGNRNPFIDHPHLVEQYFGKPEVLSQEKLGYNCTSDSFVDTGTCKGLKPGSLMFIAFNSQNPDQFLFYAVDEIPAGATIFVTDNAWTGTKFRSNEGVLKIGVHNQNIPAGTIFGYGTPRGEAWVHFQSGGGSFALATAGDTLITYCLSSDGRPLHLNALSFDGGWLPPSSNENSFGTKGSALPGTLPHNCAVSLPHRDNYEFVGNINGNRNNMLSSLTAPMNWNGSDNFRITMDDSEEVSPSETFNLFMILCLPIFFYL